ncbi:MAG: 4-hydroxy-3-polyprenylbenzoate decarboxylase [Clostridia bacterium]|nr:4-hydroxy-3-polyprenylbenzoate decarboxylase [Clostridia bacterium]
MAYRDLRAYLEAVEARGLLHRVRVEVDPILEIAALSDRMVKSGGPALFFEKVRGSRYPVVTNLFGSEELVKLALEVDDLKEPARRLEEALSLPARGGLKTGLAALARLVEAGRWLPKRVKKAPCQEVVLDPPSLDELPVLQLWPQDAGRFITLPLVFTRNPETGQQNMGMYRMQVFNSLTTGMHWHPTKDGARHYRLADKKLEVAVALGADPAIIYAATAPLPPEFDEMLLAGFLRREGVEMTRALTVDLEVPAQAEFILEGYVEIGEKLLEGPFGDHTGYYSAPDYYPVFHLTCMTARRDAIYPATVVGVPPMEDAFLGRVTEHLFLPLIRLQLPEIKDIHFPVAGVFHNCAIISIEKSYPGQARKVMYACWGLGQLMATKFIIVVDADVNIRDPEELWWRVWGNVDPRRDTVIVEGPLDALDHSSPHPGYGSKMGIDATRKWREEGHPRPWPDEARPDDKTLALIARRWKEYGFK